MSVVRCLPFVVALAACSNTPESGSWQVTPTGFDDACGVTDGEVPEPFVTTLDIEGGTQTDDNGDRLTCDLSGDVMTCTRSVEDVPSGTLDVVVVTGLVETWTFDGSEAADIVGNGTVSCEGPDCDAFGEGWTANTGSTLPCRIDVVGTAVWVE